MKFKVLLLVISILLGVVSCGQQSLKSFFEKGDRVCFVGNSITNNGLFHHNLFLYHITRFPDQSVTFFNCGVSGDNTYRALNRMADDILINQPTVAVIMLGMNDVNRSLYGPKPSNNSVTLSLRSKAIDTYKANLENFVKIFWERKIRIILQKPTIYDQTAKIATFNNFGVNDALKNCADFIDEMARKYQIPVVDYWPIMNEINRKVQAFLRTSIS